MPKTDHSKVQNLVVDENSASQRIDNFLFNKIKNVPKSRVYKMIRGGEVRVNKKRVTASYKIQAEDVIRVPPFWSDIKKTSGKPNSKLIKLLLDRIIFEDKRILVINKPAGVASHGGSGINFGVIETLREARPDLKDLELAHRLDRDTSGCLVLAKRKSVLREFHRLSQAGKILKKYILLVKGKWIGGQKKVNLPLLKNQLRSGERMVEVNDEGKESITIFKPLRISSKVSFLEAKLKTGRTHQIRVHASHIGYPIVGDQKYGHESFNNKMRKQGVKRLFLHAVELGFTWESGEKMDFKAPLDDELQEVLDKIV